MTQEQAARLEAVKKGFVPGTLVDPERGEGDGGGYGNSSGKGVLFRGSDFVVDAFGTVHAAAGHQMTTATQGKAARTGLMQEALKAAGMGGYRFTDAEARAFVTEFRKGRPTFGTARRMDDGTYNERLNNFGNIADNILNKMGIKGMDEVILPDSTPAQPDEPGPSGDVFDYESDAYGVDSGERDTGVSDAAATRDNESDGGSDRGGRSGGRGGGTSASSSDRGQTRSSYDDFSGFHSGRAMGGRVGMQAGGVAAQPAGFVEGPPENFTEKQTVADDRPMSVPEGTFVINAAAVEFAGSDDIKEMLSKAYAKLQKKVDKSIRVAKIPTEDEIDVAVSRGEVIVPPEIAKIIGYDRLEKINNRGKKEVTRRQKKAGGGFLAGKKLAEGGEAKDNPALNYEDKIIRDEVARKIGILLENFEKQTGGEQVYTENFDPQYQDDYINVEFFDMLARLNNMTLLKGDYASGGKYDVNAPTTPTLFNLFVLAEELAHSDYFRNEGLQRENPHSPFLEDQPGYVDNPDYQIFEAESDYLEELRAKTIAFETVGQMLPKSQKFAEMTLDRYKEAFLRHLKYERASPEVIAAMTEKYDLDDTMYVQYPLGQRSPYDFEVTKEQMHRSAVGDEKDLMLYDETPYGYASGGEVDYEDRIVTDEVRRKMKALVESLPDDVDVQSVYLQDGYPERQRLEDERARLNETLPTKGRFFSRGQVHTRAGTKRSSEPMINVPMTPTLYNLAILAEEVAHQDAYKYRQTYDPEKHKVDRETFFREQNYLEELRAKDFALTVVGGLLPKGDKTARGARASYEKDFAEYLAYSDNPELVATYLKKYPELKRFIKEVSYPEAKMGSRTIPGGSFLTITDDNYYGPGQPKVNPDSSFLTAANREDVIAMNEYHASFGYMLDRLKYLVTQIFDPYVTEPRYVEGYTASLPD
jgi:hypothetical protein